MPKTKGRVVLLRRDEGGYHIYSAVEKNLKLTGDFCDDWVMATGLKLEVGQECEIILSVQHREIRETYREPPEERTFGVIPRGGTMTGRS